MQKEIIAKELNSDGEWKDIGVDLDAVGECPMCHTALKPIELAAFCTDQKLIVVHYCFACEEYYVGIYTFGSLVFEKPAFFPKSADRIHFDATLEELSPTFVEIYSQAICAEDQGLDQICGIGFRKSIEFLIKDYACHNQPENADTIKKESLANSIKRISDNRIQTLASRATWIGNDETHYVRKQKSLDIADMKRFINAMIHFIESELAFEEALSIQPQK